MLAGRLVSILINNYNYGQFVGDAIRSALVQTYQPIEIIVVDDGSTDNSRQIIESFGDRITPIFKTNGGQASALNAGFSICKGEIVLFLDSDDLLNPNAIEQVVRHWSPKFSKAQFPLQAINEAGWPTGEIIPKLTLAEGDLLPELLARGSYSTAPTSGNAFSRQFLTQVMPVPEDIWVSHADCYLIHLAPFFGQVGRLDAVLGKYRLHTRTLSLSALAIDGKISTKRLRFYLIREVRQLELIENAARARGLSMSANNILNGYSHYKFRFASLKLDAAAHPFENDTLWHLGTELVRKAWKQKNLSIPTKVSFFIWTCLVAILPANLAQPLIVRGLSPQNRSKILNRLVEMGDAARNSRRQHAF